MLPILIGIGTALIGIGKGVKAHFDSKKAKSVNQDAEDLIEEAKLLVEQARRASSISLNVLGSKKIFVLDKSISRFIKTFKKIKNFEVESSVGLNELNKFRLDKQDIVELRQLSNYASSIAGGAAAGAAFGALAGFGVHAAVMGAANAGLLTGGAGIYGAAAGNATMAFLGGGSLAAGGLGVAGGAAILGGLVAGPALAVMGFVVGAKAKANLDRAYSNYAEAEKTAEELGVVADMCNAIRRRSYLFDRLLIRLDAIFAPLVYRFDKIVKKYGKDYLTYPAEAKQLIAEAYALAGAVKSALDTPILTSDGKLTKKSRLIASTIQEQISGEGYIGDEPSQIEADE
jgi:hypothetical protein